MNMAANNKTTLAFGLMLLALALGRPAFGGSSHDCAASPGEASCNSTGNAGCDTSNKPAAAATCTKAWDPEDEPLFRIGEQCFQDFCKTCNACTWKANASALILHRSTPGTQTVLLDPASGGNRFDASDLEFPFAAGPRISLTA